MASNIEITVELNKLLQEQLKLVDEQNKSLKEQAKLSEAVVEAFSKIKNVRSSESVNALNSSIQQAKKSSDEFTGSYSQGLANIAKKSITVDKNTKMFLGKMDKLMKYPTKLLAMEQAFVGIVNGIQMSNSALGSLLDITGSVIRSFGNLAISIITLPFKMLNTLMAEAASISGVELARAIEDVRKQFGDLTRNEGQAVIKSFRSMGGELSNTGLSVRRVLGNFAERLEFLTKVAGDMGNAFNKFQKEFMHHGEEVAAYVKGLGIAGEQIKAVADFANASGKDFTEVGRQITTMAYGVGEAFNINGKIVSRDIANMMKDFKNFGNVGVKQLTQISVFAHKLGLEIDDLLGTIDKFDNFETAAESAAQLSQAFGLQLDTLDLMFDQDPASRFDKLRKSFMATGKTVESLTRQERALLASQTGLSDKALEVGFAQSNLGLSYGDVQKQASLTEKKQLSQAEAMDKLSNSIERMIKEGEQMKGGFFDIFLQGFFKGIKWTKEWREAMMNLRRAMRQIYFAGTEVGQVFVKQFPGVKDVLTGIADLFKPEKWNKLRRGIVDIFKGFFEDLAGNQPKSLSGLFTKLQKLFFNFFDISTPAGKKVVDGFKKVFKAISNITADFAKMVMEGLTSGIVGFTDFLKNPEAFLAKGKAGASGFAKFAIELLEPIYKAVIQQWPKLKEALVNLLTFAWDKAVEFAKSHWKEGLLGLAAYLSPALAAGVVRSVGATVLSAVIKGLFSVALPKLIPYVQKFFGGLGAVAASEAKGASELSKGITTALEGAAKGSETAKKIDSKSIKEFGIKLLLVGAALAVGAVAFVGGIVGVAKVLDAAGMNSMEKIMPPLTVLGAAIVGIVAIAGAAKLMQGIPWAGMMQAMVIGALGVAALGVLSMGIAWFFEKINGMLSGITAGQAAKTIGVLIGMTTALAVLAGLIVGVGLVLANPVLGVVAAIGTVGLIALAAIATAVVEHAKSIIKSIDELKFSDGFGKKLSVFATVIKSLAEFTKVFVDLLSEAKPSFFSFSDKGEEIKKVLGTVNKTIVEVKKVLVTVIQEIANMIKSVTFSGQGAGADAMATLIESVGSLVGSVIGSAIAFGEQLLKLQSKGASAGQMVVFGQQVSKFIGTFSSVIFEGIIPQIKDLFGAIQNLNLTDKHKESFSAFASLVEVFSKVVSIFSPNSEIMKVFTIAAAAKAKDKSVDLMPQQTMDSIFEYIGKMGELFRPGGAAFESIFGFSNGILGLTNAFKPSTLKAGGDFIKAIIESIGSIASIKPGDLPDQSIDWDAVFQSMTTDILSPLVMNFSKSNLLFKEVGEIAKTIKSAYFATAGAAVKDMITEINMINESMNALNNASMPALDVALKHTADKLGLAGTNKITVAMDEINFHIQVNVNLDVDDLEWALINKTQPKLVSKK